MLPPLPLPLPLPLLLPLRPRLLLLAGSRASPRAPLLRLRLRLLPPLLLLPLLSKLLRVPPGAWARCLLAPRAGSARCPRAE